MGEDPVGLPGRLINRYRSDVQKLTIDQNGAKAPGDSEGALRDQVDRLTDELQPFLEELHERRLAEGAFNLYSKMAQGSFDDLTTSWSAEAERDKAANRLGDAESKVNAMLNEGQTAFRVQLLRKLLEKEARAYGRLGLADS
jgi:hypothetical protein